MIPLRSPLSPLVSIFFTAWAVSPVTGSYAPVWGSGRLHPDQLAGDVETLRRACLTRAGLPHFYCKGASEDPLPPVVVWSALVQLGAFWQGQAIQPVPVSPRLGIIAGVLPDGYKVKKTKEGCEFLPLTDMNGNLLPPNTVLRGGQQPGLMALLPWITRTMWDPARQELVRVPPTTENIFEPKNVVRLSPKGPSDDPADLYQTYFEVMSEVKPSGRSTEYNIEHTSLKRTRNQATSTSMHRLGMGGLYSDIFTLGGKVLAANRAGIREPRPTQKPRRPSKGLPLTSDERRGVSEGDPYWTAVAKARKNPLSSDDVRLAVEYARAYDSNKKSPPEAPELRSLRGTEKLAGFRREAIDELFPKTHTSRTTFSPGDRFPVLSKYDLVNRGGDLDPNKLAVLMGDLQKETGLSEAQVAAAISFQTGLSLRDIAGILSLQQGRRRVVTGGGQVRRMGTIPASSAIAKLYRSKRLLSYVPFAPLMREVGNDTLVLLSPVGDTPVRVMTFRRGVHMDSDFVSPRLDHTPVLVGRALQAAMLWVAAKPSRYGNERLRGSRIYLAQIGQPGVRLIYKHGDDPSLGHIEQALQAPDRLLTIPGVTTRDLMMDAQNYRERAASQPMRRALGQKAVEASESVPVAREEVAKQPETATPPESQFSAEDLVEPAPSEGVFGGIMSGFQGWRTADEPEEG